MSHDRAPEPQRQSFIKQSRGLMVMLSIGMLAGVLIWAKLRLVTDIPRSAYADPREVETPEDQTGEQDQDQDQDQDPAEDDEIESEDSELSSELSDFARDALPTP